MDTDCFFRTCDHLLVLVYSTLVIGGKQCLWYTEDQLQSSHYQACSQHGIASHSLNHISLGVDDLL